MPGESPYLSGSPGTATEPALVAPNSSMVTDSKINADDTGRLVSGTDANGNTIPNDTFVGAVSDTGPIALSGNASTTTASNNYAKPWIGTFQLLNDSGQPVTLPGGFDGNVTLGAEGATSTVGSTSCPSGSEAATTSGCVTADTLYDPTDFTPGGGDTGTVLISPLIKPGTVSSTYYNHYSTLRTLEDLFLTGATCTEPSNGDVPLSAGTVCGGLDGQGHLGYAAQSRLADFGPDVFTAQHFTPVNAPHGYQTVSGSGSTALYCPVHVNLGLGARDSHPGTGGFGGTGGTAGAPGCGSNAGKGGNGGNGDDRGRPRRQRRERWQRRLPAGGMGERQPGSPPRVVRPRRTTPHRATAPVATAETVARAGTASARPRAATAAMAATARPECPARTARRAPTVSKDVGSQPMEPAP